MLSSGHSWLWVPLGLAQGETQNAHNWPDEIARIAQLKTTVETCVATIKAHGNKAQKDRTRFDYGIAKGRADRLIEGLVITLSQNSRRKGHHFHFNSAKLLSLAGASRGRRRGAGRWLTSF